MIFLEWSEAAEAAEEPRVVGEHERSLRVDPRSVGQQSTLGVDVVAPMDALGIGPAIVAGFDWGARTSNVVAALWPDRCKAMVSVSGYLIGSREANKAPLPPPAELSWWCQYYFATEVDTY